MSTTNERFSRLTLTLTGPKHPNQCQSCGLAPTDMVLLKRWLECDDDDQPEPRPLVLCAPCSDRLIEAHPRLYRQLAPHEPMPGVMELCLECKHRDGVRCVNPIAQINGGPGLSVSYPKPTTMHVCRRDVGGWQNLYHGPVTSCSGREVIQQEESAT